MRRSSSSNRSVSARRAASAAAAAAASTSSSSSSSVTLAVVFIVLLFFSLFSPIAVADVDDSSSSSNSNGGKLQNWSLTSTIVPSNASSSSPLSSSAAGGGGGGVAFVRPRTLDEVVAAVRDEKRYPSPLLTVGSGHSSGDVVSVRDPRTKLFKGTILQMKEMKGMSLEEVNVEGGGRGGGEGGNGANKTKKKRYFVRVGAGTDLADLHDFLAARGLEISFSPEIGDATVGSGSTASMKDSSVAGGDDDGDFGEGREVGRNVGGGGVGGVSGVGASPSSSLPSSLSSPSPASPPLHLLIPPYPPSFAYKGMGDGYLGSLVRGFRFVNASGDVVDVDVRRGPTEAAMRDIRSMEGSFGLRGPVVDVLLETRPLALIETRVKVVPQRDAETDRDYVNRLLALRNEADNAFFLISLGGRALSGDRAADVPRSFRCFSYVELRTRRPGAGAGSAPLLNRALVSWWLPEAIRATKYSAFALGSVPPWLLFASKVPVLGRVLDGGAAAITHRRFLVNRYGPATLGRPRLSFTYYELDLEQFPAAAVALLELARDFRRRTGWAPGALAVYFVRRDGRKPTSNYSGARGISTTLDPVTGAPLDPRFALFLEESDALIQRRFGGRLSPSQSLPSAIGEGQATDFGGLDQQLLREGKRFATPYLERVFAADARAQELKRSGRWLE